MHLADVLPTGTPNLAVITQPYAAARTSKTGRYYDLIQCSHPYGGITLPHGRSIMQNGKPAVEPWFAEDQDSTWSDIDFVVQRARLTVRYAPDRIDYAYTVGESESILPGITLTTSTRWIAMQEYDDFYIRLSEAHTVGISANEAFRVPVEYGGVALEFTTHPDETGPQHAITMFALFRRHYYDTQNIWYSPARTARIYDHRAYVSYPATHGITNNSSNRVTDKGLTATVLKAVREVIATTVFSKD